MSTTHFAPQLLKLSLLLATTFALHSSVSASVAIDKAANTASDSQWRTLDPEQTLVIDTNKGRMIIEMRPEMAPKAIERIKLVTREKIYDGLQFHRVIAKFVAQTGNPNNKDGGGTSHPNLAGEMMFRLPYQSVTNFAAHSSDASTGFIGSVPFQSLPMADAIARNNGNLRSWGAHCTGVAGMGRNEPRDSANSELYFMLDASRRLDRDYTVFGRVVIGLDVLMSIKYGEPPSDPDVMKQVRILSDIPANERPQVLVASETAMKQLIDQTREKKGADFSVCDVPIPAKVIPAK